MGTTTWATTKVIIPIEIQNILRNAWEHNPNHRYTSEEVYNKLFEYYRNHFDLKQHSKQQKKDKQQKQQMHDHHQSCYDNKDKNYYFQQEDTDDETISVDI